MSTNRANIQEIPERLRDFWLSMPFNLFLGMAIDHTEQEGLCLTFEMKKDFVGNNLKGDLLHGGVIAAMLDTMGGVLASLRAVTNSQGKLLNGKGGTLDLRIDYLRPGIGNRFRATGSVLRGGKRVVVTRMELKNQDETLIAVGTGTYMIG